MVCEDTSGAHSAWPFFAGGRSAGHFRISHGELTVPGSVCACHSHVTTVPLPVLVCVRNLKQTAGSRLGCRRLVPAPRVGGLHRPSLGFPSCPHLLPDGASRE